jgi:hypothetical protein
MLPILCDFYNDSFQPLYTNLDADVTEQTALLANVRDTLTELNSIGDQISLSSDGNNEERMNQTRALQRHLDALTSKAATIDEAFEQPIKFVQRKPLPKPLAQNIEELQSALREREAYLHNQAQLEFVAPQMNSVNDALETQFDVLTQGPQDSLDQQQALLQDLAHKKRLLEESLAALPEGPEAQQLRERSQWNLSRLGDWLKRLADAVGDRLAALAAFNATREDINRQVSEFRKQIVSQDETSQPDQLQENMRRFEVY